MSAEKMTMSMDTQSKNPILVDFKDEFVRLKQSSAPWLADLRERAWVRFAEIGIPTTRNEEWKYFDLRSFPSKVLTPSSTVPSSGLHTLKDYLDEGDVNIVFVNGVSSKEFSTIGRLPKGLTIERLSESAPEKISGMFTRTSVNDPEPFVSLNTALHRDGVYLRVEDNTLISGVVHIVHVVSVTAKDSAVFPRTIISIGRSARVSILESFISLNDEAYLNNPFTDIHLGENSVLNYYKSQSDSPKALHIGAVRVSQDANSQLEAFSLAVGARMARNNISVAADGEGTDSILDGLYVLSGSQEVDNHTLIDHRQPNSTSHQLYKGILNDQSHAVFNGKIFVRPIAQKTNSYQLNKHLLLGNECRVDTKPQLEIFADDVKCTHGATIGQLNEDEVFYLQTRCISREDAIKMLSRGFVDDLLDKLRDQNVRRKLSRLLAKKIAILS